eukprot:gnl/Trimastix_PCT/2704.p1 GENE.gnl/Trimastix_PCT/2704~~gnl/Trimastix_PCT/2704.p1  ORF type:complete len:537 (-),score=67.78 gnl/Trimastix_PCT/2704:149-1729(-)
MNARKEEKSPLLGLSSPDIVSPEEEIPQDWVDCFERVPMNNFGRFKLVLGAIFLVPIRLLLFILVLIYHMILMLMFGMCLGKNKSKPLPRWRRGVVKFFGMCWSRIVLWIMGYYHIKHRGKPNYTRSSCFVSNHITAIEMLSLIVTCSPSFVIAEFIYKMPIIHRLCRLQQVVVVDRFSKGNASAVVKRLISDDKRWPSVCIYPEGATTNGTHITRFSSGAFLAGLPVQPVCVRHPYKTFDPSWCSYHGLLHLGGLMCQLYNRLEITYLPVYHPSPAEKADPRFYAYNVRNTIAAALQKPTSNVTLHDRCEFERRRAKIPQHLRPRPQKCPVLPADPPVPMEAVDPSNRDYYSNAVPSKQWLATSQPSPVPPLRNGVSGYDHAVNPEELAPATLHTHAQPPAQHASQLEAATSPTRTPLLSEVRDPAPTTICSFPQQQNTLTHSHANTYTPPTTPPHTPPRTHTPAALLTETSLAQPPPVCTHTHTQAQSSSSPSPMVGEKGMDYATESEIRRSESQSMLVASMGS